MAANAASGGSSWPSRAYGRGRERQCRAPRDCRPPCRASPTSGTTKLATTRIRSGAMSAAANRFALDAIRAMLGAGARRLLRYPGVNFVSRSSPLATQNSGVDESPSATWLDERKAMRVFHPKAPDWPRLRRSRATPRTSSASVRRGFASVIPLDHLHAFGVGRTLHDRPRIDRSREASSSSGYLAPCSLRARRGP